MKTSQSRLAGIIALILVSIIMIFHWLGWWRPIQSVVDIIASPAISTVSSVSRWFGGGFSTFTNLTRLADENNRLRSDLAERDSRLADKLEIQKENELLRQQLGFQKNQPLALVGATVIGYSPDNVRRNLTINRGESDGVAVGQAVVSSGVLIGKIERVNTSTAIVYLISDPEFRIQAIAQSERARGIVRGQIGSGLRLEQVAQNEALNIGEYVITLGSDRVPKGLLVGRIESIDRSDNEIFQAANVKSLVDMSRLELVYVVKQ
ncbi:rod shape-determining protein MreC [Candidatus Saccharibacteria bacterium]|nr:rod shape-determining protein MreC [Candidatus Saccharibacteria bacterium]